MRVDLDDAWEVLAEAVQTVMRKAGFAQSYERMKDLTRGTGSPKRRWRHLFSLDLPEEEKNASVSLTPATYIGPARTSFAILQTSCLNSRKRFRASYVLTFRLIFDYINGFKFRGRARRILCMPL